MSERQLYEAGQTIASAMRSLRETHGLHDYQVVMSTLFAVGSVMGSLGCVLESDGSIGSQLAPLVSGYDAGRRNALKSAQKH
jgi:uncharacterized membrane protein